MHRSKGLFDELQEFAVRVKPMLTYCDNEAQTKNSLIEPYIKQILGRDVRNPQIVKLEYVTGIGKRDEKVDYALFSEDAPVLLIEAKTWGTRFTGELTPQLKRYATDSQKTHLAAITNGIQWNWYVKRNNLLEDKPFLKVNVLEPRQIDVDWLSAVKQWESTDAVMLVVDEIEMLNQASDWLKTLSQTPSDKLSRLFLKDINESAKKATIERAKRALMRAWKEALIQHGPRAKGAPQSRDEEHTKPSIEKTDRRTASGDSNACWYQTVESDRRVELRNATELLGAIVEYCAGEHAQGRNSYLRTLSEEARGKHSLLVFSVQSIDQKRYTKQLDGYWLYNKLSNKAKLRVIKTYLKCCVRIDGTSPRLGADLEVAMPNVS